MMHHDLILFDDLLYKPCGLRLTSFTEEPESLEYNASAFLLNDKKVKYRSAKITPTKTGQFVTFWKRSHDGPIEPYHASDDFDFLVVGVRKDEDYGQFIFHKSVLADRGLVSKIHEGKRGFRVYPSWDRAENAQAIKTQAWQLQYFLEISATENIGLSKTKQLFQAP